MAYDRYDRDERSRWSNDRFGRDAPRENRASGDRYGSGRPPSDRDRGFFERAGDEISSWFGGGRDDGHERDRGRASGGSGENRDYDRGYGRDYDRDRNRQQGEGGNFNEDRGLFNHGGSSERDYNRGWDRNLWGGGRDDGRNRGYEPMTGNYGAGGGSHDYDRDRERNDRSQTPYGRDEYRSTSFAGSRKDDRDFDPHYRNWRDRQMSDLDRDYDDYRREHQSKFESDFGNWRQTRQQKRGLLSQVHEHMEVVGSDEEHVGTVDKVAGDRLILTKSDRDSGNAHHSISCSTIDRVENGRVILDCKADEAKSRWRNEDRERALFERHDQGEDGPHTLGRSFSGTYR